MKNPQERNCYKCNKIFKSHNPKSLRTFCSRECYTFKYHPIIQAEFWRNVLPNSSRVGQKRESKVSIHIPTEWIPYGILKPASWAITKTTQNKTPPFTQKQIKEFREWNQKNV